MSKVSIGTDPEAFLWHDDLGRIIPACGLIGGTKRKPLHFSRALNKGFTIQEDNVAVEFNIPPAFNLDQWLDYMHAAINGVTQFIKTKGNYSLKYTSQNKFPHKDLMSEQALMFGCTPDFDAYGDGAQYKSIEPAQLADKQGAWRFTGGHIHLGYESNIPTWVAAAFADYYIGFQSIGYDDQPKRREYYGQPGRHRPTSYGIEYRTLSNYWLTDYNALTNVGHAALSLCTWLTATPVTKIRTAYQKMPWGAVRQAISIQDKQLMNQVVSYVTDEELLS